MFLLFNIIIVVFSFSSTSAIVCRDKMHSISEAVKNRSDYETRTCQGDYCIISGEKSRTDDIILHQRCVSGATFASMNNYCWANQLNSHCICDTDMCNNAVQLPKTLPGSLECGRSDWPGTRGCYACESTVYNDTRSLAEGKIETFNICSRTGMNTIGDFLRPQSCVRFQTTATFSYVRCSCDTADNCAEKLNKEQSLKSTKVICHVDSPSNVTDFCQGDMCVIEQIADNYLEYNSFVRPSRGCITNNETLFAGLYQPGYMKTVNREIVICNSNGCNLDLDSALTSIQAATTPTTTESSDSAWYKEYERLMREMLSAFDDFTISILDLFG